MVLGSHMNIRQEASALLNRIPDVGVLLEIHEGHAFPPLTEYHLQPVPESWNAPPPPDMVGGRRLVPVFKDGDSYTVYCIDAATGQFIAIDVEEPWPPEKEFSSCAEFKNYLFGLAAESRTEQVKGELRARLGIGVSQP